MRKSKQARHLEGFSLMEAAVARLLYSSISSHSCYITTKQDFHLSKQQKQPMRLKMSTITCFGNRSSFVAAGAALNADP
jgi:hypothetical protein